MMSFTHPSIGSNIELVFLVIGMNGAAVLFKYVACTLFART